MPKQADSKAANDLIKSGRSETQVETMTIVEDRTDAPALMQAIEYTSEDMEVGPFGTILTTYGEPVGGFPGEEEAA